MERKSLGTKRTGRVKTRGGTSSNLGVEITPPGAKRGGKIKTRGGTSSNLGVSGTPKRVHDEELPGPSGITVFSAEAKRRKPELRKEPVSEKEIASIVLGSSDDETSSDDYLPLASEYESSEDEDIPLDMDEFVSPSTAQPFDVGLSPVTTAATWRNSRSASPPRIPFEGSPRLKITPKGGTPRDYFNMLADDQFFEIILRETSKNAECIFLRNPSPRARITDWKPLCRDELEVWLGLLLHMGMIRTNRMSDYWKKSRLFRIPVFSETMSRDRFLGILQALHFAETPKEQDPVPTDRLYKVRPILDCFDQSMRNVVSPGKELCIDESMVLWRGRLIFRQYLQGKRHKHGIKIYMLSEPSGLVLRMIVYTGSGDAIVGGRGHTDNVVHKLSEDFKGLGHSLYMDNFYNSLKLTRDLLQSKTLCTGTLRAGRRDNPKDVVSAKLKKAELIARYTDEGICVFKWKDKRDVMMISSEFGCELTVVAGTRGAKIKPEAIARYNDFMGGVDHCDQLLSYYPCERKSLKWYKKLAVHIFQIMVVNSYVLHNKYSGCKKSMYDFRVELIDSLIGTSQRPALPRIVHSTHFPAYTESGGKHRQQKRCRMCHVKGIRKLVTTICPDCEGKPGLCLRPCFQKYHENL